MAAPNIVNISQAAKIFGYSHKTIQNYINNEGAPVVAKPGRKGAAAQIDTVAFHEWLANRRSVSDDEPDAYKRAMLGKLLEEEKKLAIQNAESLGRLVPAEDVDALYSETLVIFRTSLEGAAGRISGGNKVLRQRLLNEFRRILESTEGRLSQYMAEAATPDETAEAAA